MDLMDTDQPDEIWLAPMCGPWSQIQELNSLTAASRTALEQNRDWHHKHVLWFARTVFNKQAMAGRHAHIEHPRRARSWDTEAFQGLLAKYWVEFDQCEYGLDVDGNGLNKKPTMVATTKRAMCRLHRTCSGHHVHVRLMGGTRTHDAEDYPDKLARAIAVLMAAPDRCDKLDDCSPLTMTTTGTWQPHQTTPLPPRNPPLSMMRYGQAKAC